MDEYPSWNGFDEYSPPSGPIDDPQADSVTQTVSTEANRDGLSDAIDAEERDLDLPSNLECEEFHALFRELGLDELIINHTEENPLRHEDDNSSSRGDDTTLAAGSVSF